MARILHVVISGEMAGGQKVCLDLIQDRLELGDTMFVASPSTGPFTQQCPEGVKVEVLPFRTLRDFLHLPRLITYLRHIQPDLVHIHTTVPGNILWRLACRVIGVPLINHIHIENYFGPVGVKANLVRHLDTFTARIPKCFIAVSRYVSDMITKQGYQKERVHVVYNGVPWEVQSVRDTASVSKDKNALIIGCVGRLCESKGQKDLILAFSNILDDYPSATLWLIGKDQQSGGKYEIELRSLAGSLGISNRTVFWGHQDDVRRFMEQMDLLVLPSYDEGFPIVLLEAMSLGVPVIATRVAGVPEMIMNEETGILISPGNIDEMAESMKRVLSNPSLRKMLGEKGRQEVSKKFRKAAMLEEVRKIYASVMGKHDAACN
jgi:glycosyltransferase involved in cell wall biosynthesis